MGNSKLSIIAFSGDLDKLLATFVIATGAAASGMEVTVFTTFWGTAVMRKERAPATKKGFLERFFGWMLPKGQRGLKLSQLNMAGMGPLAMKFLMQKKNIASLDELMTTAEELGVQIHVCEMSMNLMGFAREEIKDYSHLNFSGVAGFLNQAQGGMTLFI